MLTIVNNGTGNLDAFVNIYERNNIHINIANSANELSDANKLILPGVSSFDKSMDSLNKSGMRNCLDYLVIEKEVPILGVCVGLQIMANSSDEGKETGLGWIDARVEKINFKNKNFKSKDFLPVPHLGWNKVLLKKESSLFDGINDFYFYFLHSYSINYLERSLTLTETFYGKNFISSIHFNNIYGVQFHPEKSHKSGEKLLLNFANL